MNIFELPDDKLIDICHKVSDLEKEIKKVVSGVSWTCNGSYISTEIDQLTNAIISELGRRRI